MSEKYEFHSSAEYNEEEVHYCPKCLSLRIKTLDGTLDYCDECGSTDIAITDIDSWSQMYFRKKGKDFITLSSDGKNKKLERETYLRAIARRMSSAE